MVEIYNTTGVGTVPTTGFPMEKHVLIRAIVMVVCSLAMLGAIFVIISYACFKSLRSQARQILVNLSLMDFGIALANFTGAAVNFDKYYVDNTTGSYLVGSYTVDTLCKTQAFFALLTTFASVFWTISLAIYMYLLIFQNKQQKMTYFLPLCYITCYGIPIGLSFWLLFTGRLGHAPYNSSGWCGIALINPKDESIDMMGAIFGYDLWIYLAFFMCFTVYSALFLRINVEFRDAIQLVGMKKFWKQAVQFIDFKLILIPVAFFLLRMWSCVINIMFVYVSITPEILPYSLSQTLVILAGIGDSGQGLINGLIFVFLIKDVREKVFPIRALKNWLKNGKRVHSGEDSPLLTNGRNPSPDHSNRYSRRSKKNNNGFITPTASLVTDVY